MAKQEPSAQDNAAFWLPHRAAQHLFVIVRIDAGCTPMEVLTPDHVATPKSYWSRDEAEREACRLNALNRDKRAQYFVSLTRLHSRADDSASES